jgi:AcrR family transcriptional regulator
VVRTLNPAAHALKRDAFVDAALRLIVARGYQHLSIQDVLDELGASKGAFYHYFDSKGALLAAVVESTVDAATETVQPIAADPQLSAVRKLEGIFSGIAQWKGERTVLMLELLRVWFSDDNTVVREGLRRAVTERLTPQLDGILQQGVAEGSFSVSSTEGATSVLLALILGLNETASRLFLARKANAVSFEDVQPTLVSFGEAFERVLGIPAGSLALVDETAVRRWFG